MVIEIKACQIRVIERDGVAELACTAWIGVMRRVGGHLLFKGGGRWATRLIPVLSSIF